MTRVASLTVAMGDNEKESEVQGLGGGTARALFGSEHTRHDYGSTSYPPN